MKINTKYLKAQECTIQISQYNNHNPALLINSPTGERLMTASVNLPQIILRPDQICIKDYSENTGILNELIRLNIVSQPEFYVTSGFVDVPVCQLHNQAAWKEE
jgi:hypothetical protein